MTARKRPSAPTDRRDGNPSAAEQAAPAASPKPAKPLRVDRPEDLLRASLTALDNVRQDVVKHHTDMIERLLGVQRGPAETRPKMPTLRLGGMETFGLRKFEDVLDQRVAAALARLGYPDAGAWQAMQDELDRLRDQVQQLQAQHDAQREALELHGSGAREPRAASKTRSASKAGGAPAGRSRKASARGQQVKSSD